MCDIDLESCSVWRETPRAARKTHHCASCRAPISPGTAYLEHFSIFDGGPCRESMCFACWATREEFREGGHPLFNPSWLPEALTGCIDWNDPEDESSVRWRHLLAALDARREAIRAA